MGLEEAKEDEKGRKAHSRVARFLNRIRKLLKECLSSRRTPPFRELLPWNERKMWTESVNTLLKRGTLRPSRNSHSALAIRIRIPVHPHPQSQRPRSLGTKFPTPLQSRQSAVPPLGRSTRTRIRFDGSTREQGSRSSCCCRRVLESGEGGGVEILFSGRGNGAGRDDVRHFFREEVVDRLELREGGREELVHTIIEPP